MPTERLVVGVELVERVGHALRERGVDGVAHLGAVERDDQDAVAALGEDGGLVGHGAGLYPRVAARTAARRRTA